MSEYKTREQLVNEYLNEYADFRHHQEFLSGAIKAIQTAYTRGQEEARQGIWELLEEYWKENGSRETIEIFPQHLKLLVFGDQR